MSIYSTCIAACVALAGSAAAQTVVQVGQQVTISVTADGTQPFTYQWMKNGTNITGATNQTLVFTSASLADSGTYTVSVSNSAGAATSSPANLQVSATTGLTFDQLGKQFARVDVTLPWAPAASQFLTIVGNVAVEDPGNHYNTATGIYTVGTGEGGRYRIIINARPDDQLPGGISYGICAGTTNADAPSMGWKCTNPPAVEGSGLWMRNGAQHIVEQTFKDGDQLRAYVYCQQAIKFVGFEIIFERVN